MSIWLLTVTRITISNYTQVTTAFGFCSTSLLCLRYSKLVQLFKAKTSRFLLQVFINKPNVFSVIQPTAQTHHRNNYNLNYFKITVWSSTPTTISTTTTVSSSIHHTCSWVDGVVVVLLSPRPAELLRCYCYQMYRVLTTLQPQTHETVKQSLAAELQQQQQQQLLLLLLLQQQQQQLNQQLL